MKAKLYVCIILTALIAVFTISGCNKAPEHEPVATLDEATVDEVVISSTAITETTAITTVAPTETTVEETTTAPEATTKAEEVTEAIEVNQTSDKVTASNTDKTENNASVNTQKPNNTSGNANSNTTSNTTNKTNNNTVSNTEKPKPKPVETKPKETQPPATEAPVVITDDTPLTFEQMNTAENMQKVVNACNAYFETLGMTYNEELDPSWAGWYFGRQGGLCITDFVSVNKEIETTIECIKEQVDAVLIEYYDHEYSDFYFKTLYELTDDGTYDIIFCYG